MLDAAVRMATERQASAGQSALNKLIALLLAW